MHKIMTHNTAFCTHGKHKVPAKHIAATRKDLDTGRTTSTCYTCLNEMVKGPTVKKRIFSGAELQNRTDGRANNGPL